MEYFAYALNHWFPSVIKDVLNSELFFELIRIDELGDQVVAHLETFEKKDPGYPWQKDIELVGLFDKLYKCGCISLPKDPVHRIRWIALACVLFSKQRKFSYGNVLIPHDWVPDEELEHYEHWGYIFTEEARQFRKELSEKGWNWLLEPA